MRVLLTNALNTLTTKMTWPTTLCSKFRAIKLKRKEKTFSTHQKKRLSSNRLQKSSLTRNQVKILVQASLLRKIAALTTNNMMNKNRKIMKK
jgi:predicted metal-binding transcription factor (methanogenesis marker protein 9)